MNDDLALLTAVQRGDRAAFESLLRDHQRMVYGYLRARVVTLADVEDLTQEVFLRCYQSRANFDSQVLVRSWLIGIARNLLREHIRKVKQRKEIAWTELCLELESFSELRYDPQEDRLEHLPGCLGELGPSARDALDLRYRDQLPVEEIGQRLHRSEGAIKLLMFRARQALKLCLQTKLRGNR